jgi:hypothetical protein
MTCVVNVLLFIVIVFCGANSIYIDVGEVWKFYKIRRWSNQYKLCTWSREYIFYLLRIIIIKAPIIIIITWIKSVQITAVKPPEILKNRLIGVYLRPLYVFFLFQQPNYWGISSWVSEWVSEWVLLNAKSAIFQLYHGQQVNFSMRWW